MQVKDLMTSRPDFIGSDVTIREVAKRMQQEDLGFAPIAEGDRLIGVITDRDLAVRALADGKSPDDKVGSVMTSDVSYCFEDDDVIDVLQSMEQEQVQRLIVLNNRDSKDFVGVVSLSDIADNCKDAEMAKQIVDCCRHYH